LWFSFFFVGFFLMSAPASLQNTPYLTRIAADQIPFHRPQAYDAATLAGARAILDDVRQNGDAAIRHHAERLGDLKPGEALFYPPTALAAALAGLPEETRQVLTRVADRIRSFAEAQKACFQPLRHPIPGGFAGHHVLPVESAGCYAPGGRFVLPSSVLMTAIPARVAGVQNVWLASPRPNPVSMAAAALAGVDGLLAIGGAQAIGALVKGTEFTTPCDVVVGPGNRWVTAAKQILAGEVAIDMLAGPSELLILADETANPSIVAADLLAQAEHDPDALPVLVTTSAALCDAVEAALARQLVDLPTAEIARAALKNGFAVVVPTLADGIEICNRLASEHLEVLVQNPDAVIPHLRHAGGLFVGANAAEVIGDYGAGPNHTLPTGGTARSRAGLSVFTFLRARTFIDIQDPVAANGLYTDSAALGRLEGLEAHARAADLRRMKTANK
jgi:histidinol dehydrogenase